METSASYEARYAPLPYPTHQIEPKIESTVAEEVAVSVEMFDEQSGTWVTHRTGHMGNTSSLRKGGSDALEGVFGDG
jgi:hypothetical protein